MNRQALYNDLRVEFIARLYDGGGNTTLEKAFDHYRESALFRQTVDSMVAATMLLVDKHTQ